MPTLTALDSFQHRILPVIANQTGKNYSAITGGGTLPNHGGGNISFDATQPRTASHACSLKFTMDGVTATNIRYITPPGQTTVCVGSFYFRATAAPAAACTILIIQNANGNANIAIKTDGHIQAQIVGGTAQASAGSVADSAWHRIDFYANAVGATTTLDVSVDGTALTQATHAQTSGNFTIPILGTTAIQAATYWISDLVFSATIADHPIGDHICKTLTINGSGSHSDTGAGFITQPGAGTTNYDTFVDDPWDGTTPLFTNPGADYVAQAAIAANDYLEFTLTDPSESVIWDVQLISMMASTGATTANTCRAALFVSGSATADTGVIDPSDSATNYSYFRTFAARPAGGWDGTKLSGATVRWGYATDATPDPVANAFLVEYAAPASVTVAGELAAATADALVPVVTAFGKSPPFAHPIRRLVPLLGR